MPGDDAVVDAGRAVEAGAKPPSEEPAAITIVYPAGLNWFYARLALALEEGLRALGQPARAVAAASLCPEAMHRDRVALVISPAECAASAADARLFVAALRDFGRRVLVNYDSLYTPWFAGHLALGDGLFTDLFDIGVAPQASASHLDLPYRWIGEAAWLRPQGREDCPWTPGRPLPWAVIGHAHGARADLVSGLVRMGAPGGFVYLPPLRPFGGGAGLGEDELRAVLERSDLYIWNSHHLHPYHEGLRAIHAVTAGAAPAKIDADHAGQFRDVPWVYPSLDALFEAREREGVEGLHRAAKAFIDRFPPLAEGVMKALAA